MKRTTSILPNGWAKAYRPKAKVNEPAQSDDVWDDIAPDPSNRPNRANRRAQIRRLDRSLRVGMFGWGQWRRRVR